jgi:hypothetical protein
MEIWMGRIIFANFHVRYTSQNPYTFGCKSHYVPPSILLEWFKTGKVRFPLEGATVYIDEAYMYMESRAPSKQSTEFTYMILQSRKLGANVVFCVQLTSSIDKRLKFLANYWILCNRVCLDGVHNDYHFEFMDNEGNTLNELYIREEAMKSTIYGLYDTQEIVTAAGEAEEAMTQEELGEAYTAIAPFFLKNRQRYAQWMREHVKPLVLQPQTTINQLQPVNQYVPTQARLQVQPAIMQVKRQLKPIVRQVA